MNEHHSVFGQVVKMVVSFFVWLGTVELAEWNIFIATIGGLVFIIYTVSNTYILWRDRWIRKALEKEQQRQHQQQIDKGDT